MNPALPNSSRVSRLKKRFFDVLSGSVKLDPRGATLFLEGLCAQDDPVVCLGAIIESAHGLSSVQSVMQFDLSDQFMNGLGTTVFEYLLRACDVGGDALDNMLFHVAEPPILWDAFVRAFQQGVLNEGAQLVFARVLCRLLTLQTRDTTPYRDIAAQSSIQASLISSSKPEIREIGHLIKHILSSASSVTVHGVLNGPGGRHDNDFTDYHDIAILPTPDELLCRKPPFLLTPSHDELSASETPVKDYLDHTFRILREDMLFDIRQEVQAALLKGGKYRGLCVDGVSMIDIYTGTGNRMTRWAIELQCDSDFWQLRGMKDEDNRVNFIRRDPRGSKVLRHQSLVCLTSGQDIVSFGIVNRVEELLAYKLPVIVLQLDGTVNIRKTLTSLCTGKNIRLIQLNATTFSFEPVLTALQKMGSVPLAEEILLWNPDTPIAAPRNSEALPLIANAVASNPSIDLRSLLDLPTSICLDKSQAKSLIAGLTKRVSLIQGPPGTGKSFIGTILAKAIHHKTSQTILVVCYTNHALDQFLGDLLKYNIPAKSIVRLGGRPNQSTEHLSLHEQPRGRFQRDWGEINELRCTASRHEDELKTHFDTLLHIDDANLFTHLELQHHDFFEAFYVPLETEGGMTRVGQNGKAIDEEYLFSRWTRGLDAGVLSGDPHVQASARIWGMDHSARQQQLAEWRQELIITATESICQAGHEYNKLQDAIKEELGESTVAILRQKRIIACTTTGAAIYAEAIKKVGPQFLLVEEAGEILESHILTALSHKVDQMILIGDHKQLRPKVNNYQLTVESGEGFDLNRSLFERLVLKGYPHETLLTQHRMRPEISAFVRELTYPELIDAPSTHQRSAIRGVQSNVIFVDHTHPEDDNSLIGDRADGGTKSSKQNTYEVQMVLKIVRYLAQQGYKGENIVVLTPYLGQLLQFRDALERDNDPTLNDMDSLDLARAGLSFFAPPELKAKKDRVHLATIDNYQGEESDIVVASLTRSNKSNAIGFMDAPERLNVLLSRARDGLILIGNSQTFLHSKKGGPLWRRFFTLLDSAQYVYQGFPVKCERHPERVVLLKRASDFDDLCPDGGCTDPCGFTLACGHACPMKCHPRRSSALLDPHDVSQCKRKMSAMCLAGHHRIAWECRFERPADCLACTEAKRLEEIARQALEELAQQALEQKRKREEAEAEQRHRMAELQAEEAAEEERKLQEERSKQEEELGRQREEEQKRLEEKKTKRDEKTKKLQEATRQRWKERRRHEEIRTREEKTRQLQEATYRRQEEEERERQEEQKRRRDELTERLREATRERWEEEERRSREEEIRTREEKMRQLQEATRRRQEEEEHERQEEEKRRREEQTERLRKATRKRQEEEERRRREQDMRKRVEQAMRLQEATSRRHKEEEHRVHGEQKRYREEQTKRLLEATHQRQGQSQQPSTVYLTGVKEAERLEEIARQALERWQRCEEAEIEHCRMNGPEVKLRASEGEPKLLEEQSKQEALGRQKKEEHSKRRVEERRKQEKKSKRDEKKKRKERKKQEEKKRKREERAQRKLGKNLKTRWIPGHWREAAAALPWTYYS